VLVAVVPLADGLLLVDAAPNTPPLTEAGTVVSFAFAAEALNAAIVSEPVELIEVNTIVAAGFCLLHQTLDYLRRIDYAHHTGLAMSRLTTVIPYGVCIVDSQSEDR
jgi:hypothetical protein